MSRADGKSNTIWIVLGVVAGLTLLCCAGAGVAGYFGVQRVADHEGGLEGGLRAIVANLAGESGVAAEEFCGVFLAEHRVDDAWDRTSPEFRAVTDREGFQDLHDLIAGVMGDFEGMTIRTYNVNNRIGAGGGVLHALVYDGTFAEGAATVEITMRERDGDFFLERIQVNSPLFMAKLKEKILEPAEESDRETDQPVPQPEGQSEER